MKLTAFLASTFLCFTPLIYAAAPSPDQAAQVTLGAAITVSVATKKQATGMVTVPAGATVNVVDVRKKKLLISFLGNQTWVSRSQTDFDSRSSATAALHKDQAAQQARSQAALQKSQEAKSAAFNQQVANADAAQKSKLQNYSSPLEKGAYDANRSTVDYYDWLGRRYHIGTYGQRIYQ